VLRALLQAPSQSQPRAPKRQRRNVSFQSESTESDSECQASAAPAPSRPSTAPHCSPHNAPTVRLAPRRGAARRPPTQLLCCPLRRTSQRSCVELSSAAPTKTSAIAVVRRTHHGHCNRCLLQAGGKSSYSMPGSPTFSEGTAVSR